MIPTSGFPNVLNSDGMMLRWLARGRAVLSRYDAGGYWVHTEAPSAAECEDAPAPFMHQGGRTHVQRALAYRNDTYDKITTNGLSANPMTFYEYLVSYLED